MLELKVKPTATSTIRSTETRTQCQMEWLLNVLYEGQEGRGYFITGTGLHKAFENIIKGMPFDVAEEMMLQWMENEIERFDNLGLGTMWTKSRPRESWEQDSIDLLARWYENVKPERLAEEYTLETEVWLDVSTPDFELRTQVDLLMTDFSDIPRIVDWKTGANKGSDDRQLHVYWWAVKQMYDLPEDTPMDAAFYYVHHNQWVEPKMPYPGDEAIYSMIREAERRRRLGEYHVEPSWRCKYCQVTEVCPAWADNDSLPWPELMERAKEIDWSGVNG